MTTIAPSVEPSLAEKVRGVLTFMFTELTNASMERSVDKMDRIIGLLEFERETWAMLIDKLKTEQTGAKAPNTAVSLAG
jgi:flagellin-specific chaperone FliS